MRKKMMALAGAVVAGTLLGSCQDKPSQPTAADTAAAPAADTTADTLKQTRGPKEKVPFVAPTKIGRILGDQSPSPPASR
jgi:hypothetical protein